MVGFESKFEVKFYTDIDFNIKNLHIKSYLYFLLNLWVMIKLIHVS